MKINIIGTGYVGLVTGVCLASVGHRVTCLDIDITKIDKLNHDIMPIYELGLLELIQKHRSNIEFKLLENMSDSDVVFIAVGTPPQHSGTADLSAVYKVAEYLRDHIYVKYVVIKSTVPVGTANRVSEILGNKYSVISNPEFLREGSAVIDFLRPDRIIIGCKSDDEKDLMTNIYKNIDAPIRFMDNKSAELVKYASNSFLAVKISYINEIANLCDILGANIDDVRKGMGDDHRIGYEWMQPGVGYGGSCFPKDVDALLYTSDLSLRILEAARDVNDDQKWVLLRKIADSFNISFLKDKNLKDKKFAIWGLAFKPNTDDIRESPTLYMIDWLIEYGAKIVIYDPVAVIAVTNQVCMVENKMDAIVDADALILMTEWDEFLDPDWSEIKKKMKTHKVFDGRNMWCPEYVRSYGFEYKSMGRP